MAWLRYMMGVMALLVFVSLGTSVVAAEEQQWFWLYSDDKYSKYFDPKSVKVTAKTTTSHGDVATEIEAWTKTTYSYGGADETIKNYEITNILPDPRQLSYSLALMRVNPQNRTIQYLQESFYDSSGKVVWSKAEGRIKEINSQEFDEDFYAAIVDEVFRHGEVERRKAADRWIELWKETREDGSTVHVTADTTTMRLKGANLILWEWWERRDKNNNVIQIKFMKKAVNLANGTERIVRGKEWGPAHTWQPILDDMGGAYRLIQHNAPDYQGLTRLREYAKGYSTWVNRYSLN